MKTAKKVVRSTKKFVVRHRTAIAVGATAAVLIKLNREAIKDYDAFLGENNLIDEFTTFLAGK